MKAKKMDAKVVGGGRSSTKLLIKAGANVIRAEFSELVPYKIPVWTSAPIEVEIPRNGTRDYSIGPFVGASPMKAAKEEFPDTILFPKYTVQDVAPAGSFDEMKNDTKSDQDAELSIAKIPLVALSTTVSGLVAGEKRVETHCILPIWNDGASLLVKLDWIDGEPSEGTPNPEMRMRTTAGMPLVMGLRNLEQASRLPESTCDCVYRVKFSPWLLGARLLGSKGKEIGGEIWRREWEFTDRAKFIKALNLIEENLI